MTREEALAARLRSQARKERRAERIAELAALKGEAVAGSLPSSDNAVTPPCAENAPSAPVSASEVKPRYRQIYPRRNKKLTRHHKSPKKKKKKRRKLAKRGTLKAQIVRLLGLLEAKKNGKSCRMIPECPRKEPHDGDCAYHLISQGRGDAVRFEREGIIWACSSSNYGEFRNRSLYRDKHLKLFGRERIERLEALARETRQYSRTELNELREKLRQELGA